MTKTETFDMGTASQLASPHVASLGDALAEMLRERHPHHTIKLVAKALNCTPKAAENMLDGHLSARSMTWVINAFGPGFVAEAVMRAAGTSLIGFIKSQAEEARAEANRHHEQANELDQIETALRASRRAVAQGGVGLAP